MTEQRDVASRDETARQDREAEALLRPPVDIFEDADGITLVADMPGVSKERLNLQVDRESLIIEGEAKIDMPTELEALYADIRSTRYRRSFSLSNELDIEQINAALKDGVLQVHIPKVAEVRPRKIEVSIG